MKKFPIIDLGRCSECRGCVEVAPDIFYYNTVMEMMAVREAKEYSKDLVQEAIKNCPRDCISWSEEGE